MELSKIELKILQQIANGTTDIKKIADNINRDISRIYRIKNKLIEKDFIEFSRGRFKPKKIISRISEKRFLESTKKF